jgi:hypothetical protein
MATQWDLIEYGQWQREYRQRRRRPIYQVVAAVTLEEVLEQAQTLYPSMSVSKAAARKWVGRGLVQAPTIEGRGYAKGIVAHYSTDSPAQLATAAFLKQGLKRKFTDAQIARARLFWLEGGEARGNEAGEILPGLLSLASYDGWFGVGTMESLQRALDIVIYASRLEMARRGMDVRQPVRAEFRVIFSDYPTVAVFLKKIEPVEGRDEIIVTARDIEEPA